MTPREVALLLLDEAAIEDWQALRGYGQLQRPLST
jgi:hypothetical protein